ncbi:MAG: competence/damage-inducible protein A [Ruminococcaceae bacterium]|nr:competence/damage-inducible protein A [Oscillospiraceae bacterium]
MRVEILAVGTELLLGEIANTDAQDVSQGLSELGLDVLYHTVVGDNPARVRQALELALSRVDIVITTGGLGPTYDDLTKEMCAEVFGYKLVMHEESLERIESFFTKLGRTMTENNKKQAMLPEGCTVFSNDWGTAPGCAMEKNGQHILMLPGPPRECKPMFRYRAMPYLAALSGGALHSDWLRIFGMGESAVEDKLRELMEAAVNPSVAPYAKEGECLLRVTAKAETEEAAAAMTAPMVERLKNELGDVVYGVNVDSLEQVVVEKLRAAGLTLACAESCTGGLVTKRITDVPGASAVLLGGVCSYANEIKAGVLGVNKQILAKHGAVSAPVAVMMAQGVRRLMNADIGIGITGIAGPASDDTNKPVGLVYIAVSRREGEGSVTFVRELHLSGNRERIRLSAASNALNLLRKLPV